MLRAARGEGDVTVVPMLNVVLCEGASTHAGIDVSDHHDTITTLINGWSVHHVPATGSTNDDLVAMYRDGVRGRHVVVADHQRVGRGRRGREWAAPAGENLLMSVLIDPAPDPVHAAVWRAGLAIVAAARITPGAPVCTLKWPNDVVTDGDEKVAGILSTVAVGSDASTAVVVGCGVNIGWAPDGAACVGRGTAATSSEAVWAFLGKVLAAIDTFVDADLHGLYRAELATLGRRVRVEMAAGTSAGHIDGRAVGIDAAGRLEVLDECAVTHRIDVGDVIHLRPQG